MYRFLQFDQGYKFTEQDSQRLHQGVVTLCALVGVRFYICRSIQRAYQNLEQLNVNVSQAVDTRKEVDLRIGKEGYHGLTCF